ncbi:hypothetical protein CO112_02645 [Candidatus Dojkabacteria bacterium CG_4_9_14_3_um_filter_150_Dojkabacteria_WS6_41_13]|uniref:OmpR/PhoB-type domain-containing protein n=1 Tax=Candidatus Dojkabacteria bacterium CG_4_10_14_0_2_um_filter_Dojkabacteria_WS6_41_15 TaxID=2014249 RepID=A0A2M7W259_9BACT|nr:MAG: hypothetical protein COX64_02165 [Candidatus Dojkabacteria bacterium CG_4_10_14_0_2_um_filter_Dojkabacteria_WS6_41_15]PJB22759.1 MAG: hypothetical protein CO112_02645 [Candidatus Dojkabacteria bacterium CG_4_9_14_3_um_filter_150_Dojkabacteria_WS6_41_13]
MNNVITQLPRHHFGHVTDKVLRSLSQGENVLVTGMPGFGRVYFPKFIKKLLAENYSDIKTLNIDTDLLDKQSCNAINSQVKEQLVLAANKDLTLALKELSVTTRIVFIVEGVSPNTAREILHLITSYIQLNPGRISVLTIARCSALRSVTLNSSEGAVLFENQYIIPAFDQKGTIRMIGINNKRYGLKILPAQYEEVHRVTGGNPGLVLYFCIYLSEFELKTCKSLQHALSFPPLLSRVKDIADIFFHEALQISEKVGIINSEGKVFSELVYAYLGNFPVIERDSMLSRLSVREQRIFTVLRENYNTLVEKEKIAKVLQIPTNASLPWSAYKAVERLKAKIAPQYSILTIKGKGFILTEIQ